MPTTARYDSTQNLFVREDGAYVKTKRVRVTLAQINAGFILMAAIPGFIFSVVDCTLIAIGGAVTGATAIVLLGTRAAAPVTLVSVAVAALTESALVRAGGANATLLADGASYLPLDVNTGITIGVSGSPMATATNIDVVVNYTLASA